MTEPTAAQPPNGSAHPSREVPCVDPPRVCTPAQFVATRAWVNGLANRRTMAAMLGAASLFAAACAVAWTLTRASDASASDNLTAHEARDREFRDALKADVREMQRGVASMREDVGQMKLTVDRAMRPWVKEPSPLPLVKDGP